MMPTHGISQLGRRLLIGGAIENRRCLWRDDALGEVGLNCARISPSPKEIIAFVAHKTHHLMLREKFRYLKFNRGNQIAIKLAKHFTQALA